MLLSVVVTLVDGGEALERCLTALREQVGAPPLEVIVAWDASVEGIGAIAERHPGCRFVPMGRVVTERRIDSHAGQHELYDRRRARGLAEARGELVAILEDRGIPEPDWAAAVARLHRSRDAAVIGGTVTCGDRRWLNRAVCLCDFGRYQPPLAEGPVDWLTDVNVSYKRPALESVRETWRERYHEPVVHGALRERGEILLLSPEPTVVQRRGRLRWGPLLAERFHWGRLFGYTRFRDVSRTRRLAWLAVSPAVPIVVIARLKLHQLRRGTLLREYVPVAPLVALLVATWCAGEAWGCLTGRS